MKIETGKYERRTMCRGCHRRRQTLMTWSHGLQPGFVVPYGELCAECREELQKKDEVQS